MGARDVEDACSGMLFFLFLSIFFSLVVARTVTTMAINGSSSLCEQFQLQNFGSFVNTQEHEDLEGLHVFYYLVEDLKVGVL